jgi:glycosyltransferase involved in cell wall biosynthesis
MKVLVCTIVHNPTDARIFRREIEALLAAGHSVTAIAPWRTDTPGPAEVARVFVPRAAGRNRLASAIAARARLRDLIPSHDLVLLHDPELLLVAPWVEAKRLQVPIVWDVHEDLASAIGMKSYIPKILRLPLAWLVRRLERFAENYATLLLAEKGYQQRFRKSHQQVLNLPLVGPLNSNTERKAQAIYVGSITYERGLTEMLELAKALEPHNISVRLIGECPNPLAADEIRAARNVIWEGSLPNAQAMQAVEESMLGLSLLHDKPNYRHSMPTKILEYMASGVLVVTTPLPLAVEIASETGIVLPSFEISSYTDLAKLLADAISDRTDFENRTKTAYELVEREYNWLKAGPEFVSYLESVAQKASSK